jgi:predicted DNA repair protein MutK
MAASSLLTLLDDIASILDDVAVLSKVAAKKTTGVLGDDLALNAEQVTGVSADRELPVVWKVAKGSLINKLILVPGALLVSTFAPFFIMPLLFIGGSYLCFEGFEKVMEKFFHKAEKHKEIKIQTEEEKIKGAIRTDFILSLEIIVIALGSVSEATFVTRLFVLSLIGIGMTFGVYGFVALIVKMDDMGLWLKKNANLFAQKFGSFLLFLAPNLMKLLAFAGIVAMFLVGGGIISHAIPPIHHISESLGAFATIFEGFVGFVSGGLIVLVWTLISKFRKKA